MNPAASGAHSGRRYLIVGAAGGIGNAVCRRLAAAGAELVLVGRRLEPLQALATTLAESADRASAVRVAALDAGDGGALEAAVAEHPALDGLLNLAGSILLKPVHLVSDAEWRATLAANLDTAFVCTRVAAKHLARPGCSLVLMSSCAASIGLPAHEAIAAAKAGIEGMVRSAAASYAAKGLRVNAVAPGLTDTPMAARLTATEAARNASQALHPLGRLGQPDDIAAAITWLLGRDSAWVTGQVIGVDGGLAAIKKH